MTPVRMMIISDDTTCGIAYHHHSDNSRGVIYDPYIFMIQTNDRQ